MKEVELQVLMYMMLFSDDNFIRHIKMQVNDILTKIMYSPSLRTAGEAYMESRLPLHIYRLSIFFLIAMLSSFLAWIIGWLAEKATLQAQYQVNSTKNKRILSLFYLGYRIILWIKDEIKNNIIQMVVEDFPDFSEV